MWNSIVSIPVHCLLFYFTSPIGKHSLMTNRDIAPEITLNYPWFFCLRQTLTVLMGAIFISTSDIVTFILMGI